MRRVFLLLAATAFLAGCGGAFKAVPSEPVTPPPAAPAWRAGEAMAFLLKPPDAGASPVDDAYLARTATFRERIAEAEAAADSLRKIDRLDRGGRRTWFMDGQDPVLLRIDVGDDGTIDQTQYFGPEGLYAVVHRFAQGRRTERIFWPVGEARIVEIRDNVPPYPGVWWRTEESPFRGSGTAGSEPKQGG